MKPYLCLLPLLLCACGTAEGPFAAPDSGVDHQSLCCSQMTTNVPDPYWTDRTYPCFPYDQDAGTWVYPDGGGIQYPWICFAPDGSATDCNDPACLPGISSCQVPNGFGVVGWCSR